MQGNLILKGTETEAVLDLLEESQTALSAMLSSRHIGPFKEELQTWLTKLSNIGEIVDQWLQVQSMWVSLHVYICYQIYFDFILYILGSSVQQFNHCQATAFGGKEIPKYR